MTHCIIHFLSIICQSSHHVRPGMLLNIDFIRNVCVVACWILSACCRPRAMLSPHLINGAYNRRCIGLAPAYTSCIPILCLSSQLLPEPGKLITIYHPLKPALIYHPTAFKCYVVVCTIIEAQLTAFRAYVNGLILLYCLFSSIFGNTSPQKFPPPPIFLQLTNIIQQFIIFSPQSYKIFYP